MRGWCLIHHELLYFLLLLLLIRGNMRRLLQLLLLLLLHFSMLSKPSRQIHHANKMSEWLAPCRSLFLITRLTRSADPQSKETLPARLFDVSLIGDQCATRDALEKYAWLEREVRKRPLAQMLRLNFLLGRPHVRYASLRTRGSGTLRSERHLLCRRIERLRLHSRVSWLRRLSSDGCELAYRN